MLIPIVCIAVIGLVCYALFINKIKGAQAVYININSNSEISTSVDDVDLPNTAEYPIPRNRLGLPPGPPPLPFFGNMLQFDQDMVKVRSLRYRKIRQAEQAIMMWRETGGCLENRRYLN